MWLDMNKKVAIVTGGANGIGRGIVEKLANEGVRVIIADIDKVNGKETERILQEQNFTVEYWWVDLKNDKQVENLFKQIVDKYEQLDILICNAGIQIREWAVDFLMEEFDDLMSINLRAYYLCSKLAARYMKQQENGGSIVCISSVNSISFHSKRSPYNISKSAINGMVGTLGVEWGRYNVRINAVAPGYVLTELMESGVREGIIDEKKIMSVIPMKRYISIKEISNAVFFLASEAASGITGQVLYVDGGWSKNALPEEKELL